MSGWLFDRPRTGHSLYTLVVRRPTQISTSRRGTTSSSVLPLESVSSVHLLLSRHQSIRLFYLICLFYVKHLRFQIPLVLRTPSSVPYPWSGVFRVKTLSQSTVLTVDPTVTISHDPVHPSPRFSSNNFYVCRPRGSGFRIDRMLSPDSDRWHFYTMDLD